MRSFGLLLLYYFLGVVLVVGRPKGSTTQSKKENSALALTRKRLLSELRELSEQNLLLDVPFNTSSTDESGIRLSPMKSNLLEWHFSFTGMQGSAYEGGVYHGRILLHQEYPRKAPAISMLSPSGRWEVNKDICLSASAHHQETWDMSWNLRTLVMSLRGFIVTQPREIGGILTTVERQKQLAKLSRGWACSVCGVHHQDLLGSDAMAEVLLSSPLPIGSSPAGRRLPVPLSRVFVTRDIKKMIGGAKAQPDEAPDTSSSSSSVQREEAAPKQDPKPSSSKKRMSRRRKPPQTGLAKLLALSLFSIIILLFNSYSFLFEGGGAQAKTTIW